jgi:hypothetical protein
LQKRKEIKSLVLAVCPSTDNQSFVTSAAATQQRNTKIPFSCCRRYCSESLHYEHSIMPYQSSFTLLIIGGAFVSVSGLIGSLNWLNEGKRKRSIEKDHWRHHLENRDLAIKAFLKQQSTK